MTYPKLYEIKPKQWVKIRDGSDDEGKELFFDHLDGMYSVCYHEGRLVHLYAYAPVEVVDKQKEI